MKHLKKLFPLILILFGMGYLIYFKSHPQGALVSDHKTSRIKPHKIITTVYPSQGIRKVKSHFVFQAPPPIEIKKAILPFMTDHAIGKSYRLLKEVKAMESKKYEKSFGKKLDEHGGFTFYLPSKKDENHSMPAAINQSNQKLYPVSQVFHLEKISENERVKLKNEGHQEYYYHSRLKLMSIINRPEEWEQKYTNLLAQGYKVKLEVLKEPNQIK